MKKYILFLPLLIISTIITMKKDPHQVYLNRYPKLRKTYEQCSNENNIFLRTIDTTAQKIKTNYPDFYKNGIQLFVIGCRRGDIIKGTMEIFKKYGIENISLRGIDQFAIHVEKTKKKIKDGVIFKDDFETYQLTGQDKKYANFVLALQVCHHIKKIDSFVEKLQEITQQDAVIIFAHTDDSQMNSAVRFMANKFKSHHITKNVCPQLETSLNKHSTILCRTSEKPTLKIPSVAAEIRDLEKVTYEDYDNTYKKHSQSFRTIKNLIELGLDRPLESFWNSTKNWVILPAVKKNFTPENQLPLVTHVVTFKNASELLRNSIQK